MTRKHSTHAADISSAESEDPDFEDVQCSQLPTFDSDSPNLVSDHEAQSNFKLIKKLKRELSSSSKHKSKRSKVTKNTDDGFTRFSATAFANLIDALTPHQRAVIEGYGFGSLLLFSKCSIPKKITTWIPRHVDSKSGDIILGGKVISLTKECINLVLGLPLSPKPFLADSNVGKSIVLSKFGKEHLPQVTFFAKKIIKQAEMFDEDVFVCFMVNALSSFLCSNTSLIPSPKYFGVFKDIDNAKNYDWCGLVLSWLLGHVKVFNRVNSSAGSSKSRQCLGGCIYYLDVMYLNHIDFCQRQVKPDIPWISVWKDSMIQFYSDLDKKSLGVYGHRPLLDYDSICYAQSGNTEVDHLMKKLVKMCNLDKSFDQIPLTQKDSVQKPVSDMLKFARLSHQQSKCISLSHSVSGDKNVIRIVNDYAPDSVSPPCSRRRSSIGLTLAENVHDMVQKADALYNANSNNFKSSIQTPSVRKIHVCPSNSSLDPESFQKFPDFKVRNSSTGGKVPIHGPRRLVVPSHFLADKIVTQSNKYHVSKSKIANYQATCSLASSSSSSENAVLFGGVRCTFWSLGEYLKRGGCVNNFVIVTFCYHFFCTPKGHPNDSKRHYFFSNISFLFIVDIKDSKFVFLDSYYTKNDEYHAYVKDQMYVCVSKHFEESELLYPRVPRQSESNEVDFGVFVMMFCENWELPRSPLANLFQEKDIPNIRIKIANDLVFSHKNNGNKDLVITFDHKAYDNQ
uniref:Ubiquitin-like protease family profile domain-containing protein n=1 Tax=Setaria italica TaxID=4555 RepID=K3Y235_SETIT